MAIVVNYHDLASTTRRQPAADDLAVLSFLKGETGGVSLVTDTPEFNCNGQPSHPVTFYRGGFFVGKAAKLMVEGALTVQGWLPDGFALMRLVIGDEVHMFKSGVVRGAKGGLKSIVLPVIEVGEDWLINPEGDELIARSYIWERNMIRAALRRRAALPIEQIEDYKASILPTGTVIQDNRKVYNWPYPTTFYVALLMKRIHDDAERGIGLAEGGTPRLFLNAEALTGLANGARAAAAFIQSGKDRLVVADAEGETEDELLFSEVIAE